MKLTNKTGITNDAIQLIEQRNRAQMVTRHIKDIEDIRYARNLTNNENKMVTKDTWNHKNNLYKEINKQSTKQKWNLVKGDSNMVNRKQPDMIIDCGKLIYEGFQDRRLVKEKI